MFSLLSPIVLTLLSSPTVRTETPGSLFAICDNEMEVYLDGVKYTDAAMKDYLKTSEVSIPPHTQIIAISCKDTSGEEGILASTTTGIVTDGSWKCSSVKEDYWEMSDFDDSAWNNADISRGTNVASSWGLRANIDNYAHWIWPTGYPTPTTQAYCRKRLTVGSLFATCDNEMEVYLDGVKYTDAAMKDYLKTSEVRIPPHTQTIAIYCKDTGGGEGIVASTTTGIVTDGSWKCSSVKEDYWEMSDFDDSAWNNADISRGTNEASGWGLRANINNDSHWIWSEGSPTKTTQAYCRKSLVTDTCCDTVQLTSTDATFLASKYGGFVGNYSLHRSNPFANDRKIYNHDSSNYCLFWSRGAWRIDAHCTTTDSTGNAITFKTSDTYSQCPHDGDFVWQWSRTNIQDPTMKVSCTAPANVCIDTGCQKTSVGEDVEAECVYLKNVNWTSISHIYNVSTPWKEGLCKGPDSKEDCCKCLPRLPVGCVDVNDACKDSFGGLGVCKNFVKDDMSAIDFEQGSKKGLCNMAEPDCCECFSLKKTETTKP